MKYIKNLIAVVLGAFVGAFVNGGLIKISGKFIAPPPGVNTATEEGLKAGIHLFEPKHFIFPFLAHALGTLVGALVASLVSNDPKDRFAYIIGSIFLTGGIMMVFMIPAPLWFCAVDLVLAYIPMAYLGAKLARKIRPL